MPDAGTSQNAQYIVLSATDADNLIKKRTATAGTNVKLTDAGANSTLTIAAATENIAFSGVISPSQITSDQNDYNPSGLGTATALRLSTDARRKITGIAGGTSGRILVLNNVGSYAILLANENTSSTTAGNRFHIPNQWLDANQSITLIYDGTLSRWTLFGNNETLPKAFRYSPFYFNDFAVVTIDVVPWIKGVMASGTVGNPLQTNVDKNHPGIIIINSSASANSGIYYLLDTNFMGPLAGGECVEVIVRFTTITSAVYRIGIHEAFSTTAPGDGAWIEMTSTAAVLKTSSNTTTTTSATIATLATGNWYRFLIQVNADATQVTASIFSDAGALLGSQTNSANIPTGSGRGTSSGFQAYFTGTAVTELCWVDYMAQWFEGRFLERG